MKLAVFDTHTYDREALAAANDRYAHELTYLEPDATYCVPGLGVSGRLFVCQRSG